MTHAAAALRAGEDGVSTSRHWYTVRLVVGALVVALAVGVVASPALARRARPIVIKFPRFEVKPGEREVCTFVRVPTNKPLDISGAKIINQGANGLFTTHHFSVTAYTGPDSASFPPDGVVVDTGGLCIDFGPHDIQNRQLIAGALTVRNKFLLLPGLTERLEPHLDGKRKVVGFMLDSHWINGSPRRRFASVRVELLPAEPRTAKRFVKPFYGAIGNGFINVAPDTWNTAAWSWGPTTNPGLNGLDIDYLYAGSKTPSQPVCLNGVSVHMHKRGSRFTTNLARKGATPTKIFETFNWREPGQAFFDGLYGHASPYLLSLGDTLTYECQHTNGVTDPTGMTSAVKLGCEEQATAGKPPGKSMGELFLANGASGDLLHGAAKGCPRPGYDATACPPTDDTYPGRQFTGNCVKANLVFGFSSDDEMCFLLGWYYDANPGAPPGQECSLDGLPAIN